MTDNRTCTLCQGVGEITVVRKDESTRITCPRCAGTGYGVPIKR